MRSSTNRRLVRLLGAAALVCILVAAAGCGGSKSSSSASAGGTTAASIRGQTITVTLPSWGAVPKSLLADFTKQTGVKVNLVVTGWDAIRDKVAVANAGGKSLGDVTEFDWSWTGQFGKSGWYEPLDNVIPKSVRADLLNNGAFTTNGHQYAVCYSNDFRMAAYNKKQFAQAGISSPPTTLAQVLADAKTLKAKGIDQYPLTAPLSAAEGTATQWYLLTLSYGGQLFDKSFKPLFSTPGSAGYKALQFLVTAKQAGLISPAATTPGFVTDNQFYAGKAGIILTGGPDELATANDPKQSKILGQAAYMAEPGGSGPGATFGLPEGLGVTIHSQHKAAAEAFVKWWLQPKTLIALRKTIDLLPCRTSVLQKLVASGTVQGGQQVVNELSRIKPLFPQGAPNWYDRFSTDAANQINAAVQGQTTVAKAVATLAKDQQSYANG